LQMVHFKILEIPDGGQSFQWFQENCFSTICTEWINSCRCSRFWKSRMWRTILSDRSIWVTLCRFGFTFIFQSSFTCTNFVQVPRAYLLLDGKRAWGAAAHWPGWAALGARDHGAVSCARAGGAGAGRGRAAPHPPCRNQDRVRRGCDARGGPGGRSSDSCGRPRHCADCGAGCFGALAADALARVFRDVGASRLVAGAKRRARGARGRDACGRVGPACGPRHLWLVAVEFCRARHRCRARGHGPSLVAVHRRHHAGRAHAAASARRLPGLGFMV